MFSVSLITADSYQSPPIPNLDPAFSNFRGKEVKHVPVIRVFGSTPTGKKTCLHIHGVFPYMYIPCTVSENSNSFAYKLAASIDSALNVSLGCANSKNQHVYNIHQVTGIPYYGYHQKDHLFYKVYFYNPGLIKRTSELLQNGAVLSQTLQPYEAHIPFVLQFMIDYNIFGMSYINLKSVKHRRSSQLDSDMNFISNHICGSVTMNEYLPLTVIKQSMCELEVDAISLDILNKEANKDLELNPGLAAIWEDEKLRRVEASLPEAPSQLLYTQDSSRHNVPPTTNDLYQEERLMQRLHIISQVDDSISSTASNSTYPLEVPDGNDQITEEEKTQVCVSSFEFSRSNTPKIQQLTQEVPAAMCSSFLDANDADLIDMLNDLAEENCSSEPVDNDSVLGSQGSTLKELIKNDNEEEEAEDLNITCLELDTLSSWGSACNSQISGTEKNDKRVLVSSKLSSIDEENLGSPKSLKLPQYDGADDTSLNNSTINKMGSSSAKYGLKNTSEQISVQYSDVLTNFANKLDFNRLNLDVCDIEDIVSEDFNSTHYELQSGINESRRYDCKMKFKDTVFKIPSLDGNTVVSSSDSEPEPDPDITITREEAQVCIYNSARKTIPRKVVEVTPSKRKRGDDDTDLQTPKKQRNIDSAQKSSQSRSTSMRSPQVSRTYAPLNITISSPKPSIADAAAENPLDAKPSHSCHTPRRKINQLRENLLREDSPKSSSIRRKLKNTLQEMQPISEFNELEQNELQAVSQSNKQSTIISEKHPNTSMTPTILIDSSKDVRKRLSFCSTNTQSSDHPDTGVKNRSLSQNIVPDLQLTENIANETETRSIPKEVEVSVGNKMKDEVDSKKSLESSITPDVSNDKVSNRCQEQNSSSVNNTERAQDSINQLEVDSESMIEVVSEDEDVCNITFTQCIETKVRDANRSLLINETINHEAAERIVVIKTKFRPPSRNHITETMRSYGIFRDSREELFKNYRKRVSYKISNCPDIIPFKTSLDGVTGLKLWRRMKVNEFHPSGSALKTSNMKQALSGYNMVTIKPLLAPPMLKDVKKWLRAKKYLAAVNNKLVVNDQVALPNKQVQEGNIDSPKGNDNISSERILVDETVTEVCKSRLLSSQSNQSVNSVNLKEISTNEKCQHSVGSNELHQSTADSSLQKILTNSSLFKDTQTSKHLGMSYGQIECLTKDTIGNLTDKNFQNARALTMYRYLTILSLEVHLVTRGDLLPDPLQDPIEAIFYAILNDVPPNSEKKQLEHGVILLRNPAEIKFKKIHSSNISCPITYVQSEKDLLDSLIKLIRDCDPDILVGWELETLSWGYVFQRSTHIGVQNFLLQISRIPDTTTTHNVQEQDVIYLSDVKVPGRIILDVWRIMRHEAALLNYTFENIMYHVLQERHPCPSFRSLTNWWVDLNVLMHYKVINHYLVRVLGTLRILSQLDIIGRTSEHARLFGIQFYEVFSRGSQFRVESIMLRLAKPLNFIAISPSVQQRAKMRAPESLPLIMEPKSIFYTDPMIVLDFQSLYPSIIIAYNYCFSTCLGRIEHIGQNDPFEFGAATLRVTKRNILKLKGKLNFAPCGVAYVKKEVRQGVLPRMLTEILNTRLMVKQSMKLHSGSGSLLQRVLDSQQLGLKLIANVTYGYTAANFSGRMPCIELGDSVVSKGRETLERAIKMVETTPKWGAEVVYGDTDSIFVLVRGKTRKEAFEIGAEIADAVTAANPAPVKLKFEKVLHPSILQTKKRYCGYMYEEPNQEKPEYLAKGIETVRRDGCPAVSKILEKTLRILFDTGDISAIKQYVTRQFDKIMCKRVSIQDLTFAKEFRGLKGYKPTACVPALELTRRLMKKDPRAVPRTSERVRYVIVAGAPNQPLIQCVRSPLEVINDPGLTPNALYYITKVIIPPLNRCFNLMNVDVNAWYREMSHRMTLDKAPNLLSNNQKSTICQFFNSIVCATCGEQSYQAVCSNCMKQPHQTIVILHEKIRWLERSYHQLNTICQSCTGDWKTPECMSLDCPVFYRITKAREDLRQVSYLRSIIDNKE